MNEHRDTHNIFTILCFISDYIVSCKDNKKGKLPVNTWKIIDLFYCKTKIMLNFAPKLPKSVADFNNIEQHKVSKS